MSYNVLVVGLCLVSVVGCSCSGLPSVNANPEEANVNVSVPVMSRKVLITSAEVPQQALDKLRDNNCQLIIVADNNKQSVIEKISLVDAVLWATHLRLDGDILDAAGPHMKTVATMSVGYDHIDLAELKKRNIQIGHTPGVLNEAVADMAILLTLAASRRSHEARIAMESGNWKEGFQWMLGRDLRGSIVGILGLGRVGQTIAKRLKSFDVKDIYYTHRETEAGRALGAKFVPFDRLLSESDFVISAVPLTNGTAGLLGEAAFARMKPTAVFVNVGRGGLVDQPALVRALTQGRLFAAGLDVMTPEPLPSDSELLRIPNLVLMPHLGSATVNTRNDMADLTVRNILKGLAGEEMVTPVKL